jgi:hypothetical protein
MNDRERAAAGAALLDARVPGWYERIDAASINISSAYMCVLGQAFHGEHESGYMVGLRALGLDTGVASKYGFAAKSPELEEAWREEIAHRRLRVPVAA